MIHNFQYVYVYWFLRIYCKIYVHARRNVRTALQNMNDIFTYILSNVKLYGFFQMDQERICNFDVLTITSPLRGLLFRDFDGKSEISQIL